MRDVVREVGQQGGVGVVGYADGASTEDAGGEGGEAGAGAELEDGAVVEQAGCVRGVL